MGVGLEGIYCAVSLVGLSPIKTGVEPHCHSTVTDNVHA